MCKHRPECPGAASPNRDTARIVVLHPEQGWYLLCNRVVLFDDGGELLPDGTAIRSYASAAATTPVGARRGAPINAQCGEAS
ncbi:DUF5999 family protein [Streptomyces sp. NPDC001970]